MVAVMPINHRVVSVPQDKQPADMSIKDVSIRISRIGNGFQVTELSNGVPFAYYELGELPTAPPDGMPPTSVGEHISRFFQELEKKIAA